MLFLDELGEFPTQLLDALRTPLEDGVVVVARKSATVEFPRRAQVVAATNPCPCGFEGDRQKPCVCGEAAIARYRRRFSGPLLDRLDVQIRMPRLRMSELTGPEGESSGVVRDRVAAARDRQHEERGRLNCDLGRAQLDALDWTPGAQRTLRRAAELDQLTARGWDRVRKIARTIADLAGRVAVDAPEIEAAMTLREAKL